MTNARFQRFRKNRFDFKKIHRKILSEHKYIPDQSPQRFMPEILDILPILNKHRYIYDPFSGFDVADFILEPRYRIDKYYCEACLSEMEAASRRDEEETGLPEATTR